MKKVLGLVAVSMLIISCAGKTNEDKKLVLRLGHNHVETNPNHIALMSFSNEVKEKTNGAIEVKIFANSILGDDRAMTEQTQQGVLDMVRVTSAVLENFDKNYSVFSMPYLFSSEDQFYKVMNSSTMQKMHDDLAVNANLRGLTFQDASVRSFYMTDGPINTPADLKGKKVRVMNSQNSIRMMELLGGVATPMPYGEVYTGLQQGVIDGGENNPQALTLDKHGEVAKFYSLDEHLRIPDFVIISEKTWQKLTPEQQEIIRTAAKNSTILHSKMVKEAMEQAKKDAVEKMGVKINTVNIADFQALVEPMYAELETSNPQVAAIVKEIKQIK